MRGGLTERVCRILAGADTGVAGGVLVLIWLSFASRMQGEYWWSKWNVAGALFYGDRVFVMGWGRASIAGAAVLLLLYALVGVAFALLARRRGYAFNLLAGLTVALVWHQAAGWLLWPRWGPASTSYLPPQVMLPANLLFGMSLIRFSSRFRSVASALGDPAWARQFQPQPPPQPPLQPLGEPELAEPAAGPDQFPPGSPEPPPEPLLPAGALEAPPSKPSKPPANPESANSTENKDDQDRSRDC